MITRIMVIKNRTEHEAENEVLSEVKNAYDWAMTEINKEE